VVVAASSTRSQWQNRVAAQRRLCDAAQEALPGRRHRRAAPARPSRGSVERELTAKTAAGRNQGPAWPAGRWQCL